MSLKWLLIVSEVVTLAKIIWTFFTMELDKVNILYIFVYCAYSVQCVYFLIP